MQKIFLWLFIGIAFFFNLEAVYQNRFSGTFNGGIAYTGNTVGLSKLAGQNNAGTADAIGAFSSLNTSLQVGNFPPGTTLSISDNGSAAVLDLPPESEVIYAELVIAGSYGYPETPTPPPPPASNVSITITGPNSNTVTLACDPNTAQNALTPGFPASGNYVRSVVITDIVKAAGSGTYIVSQVPGTVTPSDNSHNAASWTLAVIYENPNMNTNNINFWVACEQASQTFDAQQVSGFCAPPVGPISARLFISAVEGDANLTGDHLLFGNTPVLVYPANALSGDNNPVNNFFCSQINTLVFFETDLNGKLIPVGSGQLDTRGTFGNRNQNAQAGTNISAGRQGQDITSMDISDKIANGQTSAYVLGNTVSDDYTVTSLGIQIQVGAPIIVANKFINEETSVSAAVGEAVTFSFRLSNEGTSDASQVILHDLLPEGMSFIENSVQVNNIRRPLANPSNLFLGDILIQESVLVSFQARIDSAPPEDCFYTNVASIDYEFLLCSQSSPSSATTETNFVTINVTKVGPIIQAITNANISEATNGDVITYTISIENLGDTIADQLTIRDILPTGLSFVPGSVTINGAASSDTPDSISISGLGVTSSVNVTFQAQVVAPPTPPLCIFNNQANVAYSYSNCSGVVFSSSVNTNSMPVSFQLPVAQILAIESNTPLIARLGEIITIRTSLINQSSILATNIFFQDVLPAGLTFQEGSVTIDGVSLITANPNQGFAIDDLQENVNRVITFDAQLTVLPADNRYSNTAMITYTIPCATSSNLLLTTNEISIPVISGPFLTATKSVSPSIAMIGESVTFTIVVTNEGNAATAFIILRDILPKGLSFEPDSLTYNGNLLETSTLSFVILPNLAPNESATLQFRATIDQFPDTGNTYNNTAYFDYSDIPIESENLPPYLTTQTNIATVITRGGEVKVKKWVNSAQVTRASVGETVTFSFVIKNKNNFPIHSVFFKDKLAKGLSLVPKTFRIDGELQPNPSLKKGVNLGRLEAGQVMHLEFKAKINREPNDLNFTNIGTFSYVYRDSSDSLISETIKTNRVRILLDPISDPIHFQGIVKECRFLNKNQYMLIATWQSPSQHVLFYRIYHHNKVVAIIPANKKLKYKKCLHSRRATKNFKIAAVYENHIESRHIKLKVLHE